MSALTKEQINKAMQDEIMRMTATSYRYEGVKKQFDAACLMGDNSLSDALRFQLHSLLDITLDSVGTQMALTRKLLELPD